MPLTNFEIPERYLYQTGFLANLETKNIPGALPIGQNSPQKCPYDLYAEKISGTSFTAPRWENQQTWVYRIMPSASHASFEAVPYDNSLEAKLNYITDQLRWDPFNINTDINWIRSLNIIVEAVNPALKNGVAYYIYGATRSMAEKTATYNTDGDVLIIPQLDALDI